MKFLFFFIGLISVALTAKLTTTPLENGAVYKLENQEDGAFLFASDPGSSGQLGNVISGEYSGSPGQKWKFTLEADGKDVYSLQPLANENNVISGNKYMLIKVGHGKRLLKNIQTGLCVQNYGRGRPIQERECGRDNPKQRWNAQATSA